MIRYLDFEVVRKLNYFPVNGGISTYYSPRAIVDQKALEYTKHHTITFGEFFQANNYKNPKKSNVLLTIYGIYLQSLDKIQVGHEIFIYTVTELLQDGK